MDNQQMQQYVLDMVLKSEHIEYRGVSLGQALKVPFHGFLRMQLVNQNSFFQIIVLVMRRLVSIIIRLASGILRKYTENEIGCGLENYRGKGVVVVLDHPGHVEKMARGLTERFRKDDIIIVTTSHQVYTNTKHDFPYCLEISGKRNLSKLNLRTCWRYYKELCSSLPTGGILFNVEMFYMVCSVIQFIDYYNMFLNNVKVSAIMTMSDRHFNEYLITMVSRQKSIPTFTNQHGEFTDLFDYLPIISDVIFVWGERSRDHIIKNGVPPEKVVISGNPKFDRVYSDYLPRREAARGFFQNKYGLTTDLPVVTYLSPGIFSTPEITPERGLELFKCFCQCCQLPVNMVVKLHPYQDNIELFKSWIRDVNVSQNIPLLQMEDLFDVLTITDIAVTYHSTTGIEAIGFGIPTIVMNIVDGINIRDYVTFVDDTIECQSPEAFYIEIKNIIMKPDRFQRELERIRRIRGMYLKNSYNFNTAEFVYNFIFKFAGLK